MFYHSSNFDNFNAIMKA